MKNFKLNGGQSLFEVLFAVAIASIVLVGVVSLASTSIRNSDFSQNNALATKYAQEGMEWIRQYRDTDWDESKSHSSDIIHTTWCLDTLPYPPPTWGLSNTCSGPISGTIFTRQVELWREDATNTNVVHVAVKVIWNDSQGDHEIITQSDLSDWNR